MLHRMLHYILLVSLGLLAVMIAACSSEESPESSGTETVQSNRPAAAFLEQRDDPQPIELPADAAPHDRLTEWWYYTGHLRDESNNLYGFQFVIFQVLRGDFPPTFAAHFAITDTESGTFQYTEHLETGEQAPGEYPINLRIDSWELTGGDGIDRLRADMPGYALELTMESQKPPIFHEDDGFFQFAPGAESYYYSRTNLEATGTLTVGDEVRAVEGAAWFDQQWGDFLVLDNVGWDWFSVQLDNDHELMAWYSHDREGNVIDGNATLVDQEGNATDVPFEALEIVPISNWISPRTGGTYPMGWDIEIEQYDIRLNIEPVMEDQELITLDSTGVIYWEGMVEATGTYQGSSVEGLGYVELTGYVDPGDLDT